MENSQEREQKTLTFIIALSDAYKNEDDRELNFMSPIEIPENGDMTEDIFCMLKAIHAMLIKIMGDEDMDLLDTLAILNRVAFQFLKNSQDGESDG